MGRVSPFGHPRIKACSQLPTAFRSVPRPSSPLDTKASTKCSYLSASTFMPSRTEIKPKPGEIPTGPNPTARKTAKKSDRSLQKRPSFGTEPKPRRKNPGKGQKPRRKSRAIRPSIRSAKPDSQCQRTKKQITNNAADPAKAAPRKNWWRRSGSNRRPEACKATALPTELRPHDRPQ